MNPEQQTPRRRRRTPAERRQLIAELTSSGMTVAKFCRGRDLSPSIVYRALRKLRNPAEAVGHGTQLLAVEVAGATRGAGSDKDLAVVLANGLRIEVPYGFDAATLQRLVSALERG
jgi:transposase-like protein